MWCILSKRQKTIAIAKVWLLYLLELIPLWELAVHPSRMSGREIDTPMSEGIAEYSYRLVHIVIYQSVVHAPISYSYYRENWRIRTTGR